MLKKDTISDKKTADPAQDKVQKDPAPVSAHASSQEEQEEEKNRYLFEEMSVPKALAAMAVP
ncbi:MAG: hypothetical protein U0L10_07035, partial [Lachnospiraceae bacterium]|nr:hypothetical protein [Lachnospiraceae bacterium]